MCRRASAKVVLGQPGVQVRQRLHPRDGDQEVPPEPADLALDAALLVSPADARLAVERVEPVPGPERQPAGVLLPVPALEHLRHRRRQVVVADVRPRHPAGHRERGHVPLQQRLLRAGRVDPVHAHPGERQPVGEQVAGRLPPVQLDRDRPEVDLGLRPRLLQPAARTPPGSPPAPSAPPRSPGGGGPRTWPRTSTTRPRRARRAAAPRPAWRYAAACAARPGPRRASRRSAAPPRPARATPAPAPSAERAPATPAPPAPSAGAPRASGRSPGPPSPAGDPPGPQRTVPPCPVPSAPRERVTAECDHYPRSRTTCPATSPACRRKPAHGRGQIRGELTRPARSPVEPNQRRRWGHFRVTRPPPSS